MELTFTDQAISQLSLSIDPLKDKWLKLKYDIEGCGCVVNGVFILAIVNERTKEDQVIASNYHSVLIESRYAIFGDEEMTIDYLVKAGSFLLKSPNQILNPRMSVIL